MSVIPYQTFQQDFRIDRQLGKGNCATVSLLHHLPDSRTYALKLVVSPIDQEINQAFNEVEALITLRDPSLTQLHFYFFHHNKTTGNFELGLILDLCDCTLAELIQKSQKKNALFKRSEVVHFLETTIPLLASMERRQLLHRDIKPDNILIVNARGRREYKLADFGFALQKNIYSDRNIAGTKEYVSPKLLVKFKNQKLSVRGHNIKDDVFSFGKTLYEMLTLDLGCHISSKRWPDLRKRYGNDIVTLLDLMLKENQKDRATFVALEEQLQSFSSKQHPLKRESSSPSPKMRLSSQSVRKSDASTVKIREASPKVGRTRNDSRTKKKNNASSTETTLDVRIETETKEKVEVEKKKEAGEVGKLRKELVPTKFEISCLEYTENMLFLGLEGQLGVIMIPTKKQVRFPSHDNFRDITCLKLSADEETLFIGTLSCKLFMVPVSQIKKIVQTNKSFRLKNALELDFMYLQCKELTLDSSISTLFVLPDFQYQKPSLLVGHHTGQISFVKGLKISKKIYFFNAPLTNIKLRDGTLYVSTAVGHFSRQPASYLGLECIPEKKSRFDCNLNYFKCPTAILAFEIITSSRANERIDVERHQHLAALACFDGFLYILSREMGCEQKMRISHELCLSAMVKKSSERDQGYECLFMGKEGTLVNEKGMVVKALGEKDLCSLVRTQNGVICGGFSKKVVILTEVIELD